MTKNLPAIQPALFETAAIRRRFHKDEWHFVITDVIAALTDSPDPVDYLKKMRKRDPELRKGWGQIGTPLSIDTPGGKQRLNCATAQGIFRIIQSIPSPKAEPFRQWLAQVAVERIKEEADPGLAIDRAIRKYRSNGWTYDRIKKRIDGIQKRNMLTETWASRGIGKNNRWFEYANLTNIQYKAAFKLTKAELVKHFDQTEKNANPREAMPPLALQVVDLYESVTREMTERSTAFGYRQCAEIAVQAGDMARRTVEDIEAVMGKPILPPPAQKKLKV